MYTNNGTRISEVIRELLEQATDDNKAEHAELIANALSIFKNENEVPCRKKMILIVGINHIKIDVLQAIAKTRGFEKDRLEFVEYDKVTNYPFKKLQYGSRVGVIIMGSSPHKTCDCGKYDSVYSMLVKEEGYPPVILCKSQKKKISKFSFTSSLDEAIESGLIAA